jgi:ParB family chromosome partitioning protein
MNSNGNGKLVNGLDIPMVKLVPRTERKLNAKDRRRLEASLRAVGLIDPLIVFPLDDHYEILDGVVRYYILLEMGVETVPCLLWHQRDGFTGNRMVNQLSPAQEMRMLRKSLEELDEKTIAEALGMAGISHRLNPGLQKKLEPTVNKAFGAGKLTLQCAKELTHVKPDRQAEILKLMDSCKDHSVTFAKGLVLKTPAAKRVKTNGTKTPWAQADAKKSDLLKKLQEAEQQQDFYSGLYRHYTTNLLKLVIYVRSMLANERVQAYLQEHHPLQLESLEQVINSTEQ